MANQIHGYEGITETGNLKKITVTESSGKVRLDVNSEAGPLQFTKDAATVTVTEDTVTPANNVPLPVKLVDLTGDVSITANNLNVQMTHSGANPDSIQIGDGTETWAINASNEGLVADTTTHSKLDTIITNTGAGDATAANQVTNHTKLDSLLTELQLKADLTETQPVSAASLPLPSGAATEATLSAQSAKLPASLGSKLSAASLSIVLASDHGNVPISASSLPLPTGAATSANQSTTHTKLDSLLTELQAKADLAETQPVSAASLPLPSGAATSALQTTGNTSLSNIDTSLNNIEADIGTLEDRLAGALIPEAHDYIALTYVTSGNGIGEIETATYKTGGAGGSTVGTLTMAYDANDKLSSVTKS